MPRVGKLYDSTIGKKIFMAATGAILWLFVIGHMIGNLKIFLGAEHFNAYAEFLRTVGEPLFPESGLLWIARIVLLVSVGVHMLAALQLTLLSWAARGTEKYRKQDQLAFSYASRTMRWGGVIILLFLIFHVLHLTLGTVHPSFEPGSPYHNVVAGFRVWPVSLFYILAMIPLGFHMYHGLWSACQTLDVNNKRIRDLRRPFSMAVALVVVAGNISIPLAVLAGFVH